MPKQIEVALDTNVLLDLAIDDEVVIDCLQTIRERLPSPVFVVLPTVIQELVDILEYGETEAEKKQALDSLQNIRGKWQFFAVNCMPVGHGIVEETARKIRVRGLLPEEEVHDSFLLAESGLRDVSILLSNDAHIKEIDQRALKLLFDECDIGCPLIASPKKIVTSFFQKK